MLACLIDFGSLLCALFSLCALNCATASFLSSVSANLIHIYYFAALCRVTKKTHRLILWLQTLYTKYLFVSHFLWFSTPLLVCVWKISSVGFVVVVFFIFCGRLILHGSILDCLQDICVFFSSKFS